MKGNRAVLTAVVVLVVLVVGWWLFGRGGTDVTVDLIDRFAEAEKRPTPDHFSLGEGTLAGETRRAIAVMPAPGTRLTWKVRVPDDGWLRVAIGMQEESWTKEGNGVKFLVGVSDNRGTWEVLFEQHVNPYENQGDRKWFQANVDLSTYAGEDINLIFNTYSSPANVADDQRNDMAVWGAPEIIVR